jgi:hypothetical protein
MKRKNLLLLVVGLLMASLILAACGSSSPSDVGFPTGKFVDSENDLVGYYFNENMSWAYFMYGQNGAEGTYELKDNQWIEKGTDAAGECPFAATYAWTFDGTNLTFKLVGEDKCEPRREATDGHTFVLTK